MAFHVYIVTNQRNGTIYVGQTGDLARRVFEHQRKAVPGFTAQHGLTRPVWVEAHETRESAVIREKQLKEWKRAWKLKLIESENPEWDDLAEQLNNLFPF